MEQCAALWSSVLPCALLAVAGMDWGVLFSHCCENVPLTFLLPPVHGSAPARMQIWEELY